VYALVGADADDLVLAPWWWLALVPVGALPVIAGVTSLPARLATRIPSAEALRYE
jgi:ABC-type lipoprotein release transport system permease subunit